MNFLCLWLQSVQYDLQHDFPWVTDEADCSVVLALLQVAFLGKCNVQGLGPWGWPFFCLPDLVADCRESGDYTSPPAWTSSAGMLSTPADFPFFDDSTAASTSLRRTGWSSSVSVWGQVSSEKIIAEEQAGLRAGRSTIEQIFSVRILSEKYLQHQQDLYHFFIDFNKAFDRVWHAALWVTMKYNISTNLIQVIKNLYNKATSAVLFHSSTRDWFRTAVGVRQGCLLSPTLFNVFLETIMTNALEDHEGTVSSLEAQQSPVSALLMTSMTSQEKKKN